MNLKFLSWQEGKYSDLWIIVHFLSGTIGGSLLFSLNLSAPNAWIVALIVSIGWEIFESFFNLREDWMNKMLDICIGLIGFVCTFFLLGPNLSIGSFELLTIAEIFLVLCISSFGWRNYQKYAKKQRRRK